MFGWKRPNGSAKEVENVKFINGQTDRQTPDDRWSKKLSRVFNLSELKMKKNHTYLDGNIIC